MLQEHGEYKRFFEFHQLEEKGSPTPAMTAAASASSPQALPQNYKKYESSLLKLLKEINLAFTNIFGQQEYCYNAFDYGRLTIIWHLLSTEEQNKLSSEPITDYQFFCLIGRAYTVSLNPEIKGTVEEEKWVHDTEILISRKIEALSHSETSKLTDNQKELLIFFYLQNKLMFYRADVIKTLKKIQQDPSNAEQYMSIILGTITDNDHALGSFLQFNKGEAENKHFPKNKAILNFKVDTYLHYSWDEAQKTLTEASQELEKLKKPAASSTASSVPHTSEQKHKPSIPDAKVLQKQKIVELYKAVTQVRIDKLTKLLLDEKGLYGIKLNGSYILHNMLSRLNSDERARNAFFRNCPDLLDSSLGVDATSSSETKQLNQKEAKEFLDKLLEQKFTDHEFLILTTLGNSDRLVDQLSEKLKKFITTKEQQHGKGSRATHALILGGLNQLRSSQNQKEQQIYLLSRNYDQQAMILGCFQIALKPLSGEALNVKMVKSTSIVQEEDTPPRIRKELKEDMNQDMEQWLRQQSQYTDNLKAMIAILEQKEIAPKDRINLTLNAQRCGLNINDPTIQDIIYERRNMPLSYFFNTALSLAEIKWGFWNDHTEYVLTGKEIYNLLNTYKGHPQSQELFKNLIRTRRLNLCSESEIVDICKLALEQKPDSTNLAYPEMWNLLKEKLPTLTNCGYVLLAIASQIKDRPLIAELFNQPAGWFYPEPWEKLTSLQAYQLSQLKLDPTIDTAILNNTKLQEKIREGEIIAKRPTNPKFIAAKQERLIQAYRKLLAGPVQQAKTAAQVPAVKQTEASTIISLPARAEVSENPSALFGGQQVVIRRDALQRQVGTPVDLTGAGGASTPATGGTQPELIKAGAIWERLLP